MGAYFHAMSTRPTRNDATLASRLAQARREGRSIGLTAQDDLPASAHEAFGIQHEILAQLRQPIGGWKVGARSEADALAGKIQGSPIPRDSVFASSARSRRNTYPVLGLELEIGFRLGRTFAPATCDYRADEVLASLSSFGATIEIVSSRLTGWPDVDRTLQLADLQNNGALVAGEFVPYRGDFPFRAPRVHFLHAGENAASSQSGNPAGDPRLLLVWLVNHCTRRGIEITSETVITTGTYSGIYFPKVPGEAIGEIEGLPPVHLNLD